MMQKICFICFILLFICLYLYIKIEEFATTSPQTTIPNTPISTQLTSEIARILEISASRIVKLQYTGDISSGSLAVSFSILDPNTLESTKNETSTADAAKLAQQFITSGTFKVFINGFSITLSKIPTPTTNINSYFDNPALKEIADYSIKKSISVPNDASLTNFYKLGFDSNYNIVPKLTPVTTSEPQPQPT